MALLTHPTQGSCAASSLRLKPWTKAVKAKPTLSFCRIGRIDRCNLPKNRLHLSIGSQPIVLSQRKPLRITAFKGGAHSDSDGDDDPNPSKASIRLSYASKVREDVIEASQDVSDILWRWLMMLRAPTFNQKSDCITQEVPARDEQPSKKKPISLQYKVGRLSKAMLVSFLSLDATIKFPVAVL
ncbi:hypothetical protein AMTR_s00085p00094900 [Amborella trichopoda]|uniref:Uncharacterized protein n=1 Tax=Amborella trichopoda TaxID=13333 RepID=W1P4Y2_AMBTC|nr:hypothetical protein AMTR_s00085p00094900 [Amborella trichopoda]